MTKNERILIVRLLEEASDEFMKHACNDMRPEYFEKWTDEEINNFLEEINEWNSGDLDFQRIIDIPDILFMDYLAHKLERETNE